MDNIETVPRLSFQRPEKRGLESATPGSLAEEEQTPVSCRVNSPLASTEELQWLEQALYHENWFQ